MGIGTGATRAAALQRCADKISVNGRSAEPISVHVSVNEIRSSGVSLGGPAGYGPLARARIQRVEWERALGHQLAGAPPVLD